MKAFDLAEAGASALSSTFFNKATDLPSLKAGVVAGISQSLGQSFGMDAKPGLTIGQP